MPSIANTTVISNFAHVGQKVPLSGTLGILLSLVKQDHLPLSEADTILQQMIQSGYRSPIASLADILEDR